MKCPNCGNKPVGLFPGFRLQGVGFKKALKGKFKCKHCDTLLEQKSEFGIHKYQKAYWYVLAFFFFLIAGSGWFGLYLGEIYSWSGESILISITLFGITLIGIVDSYIKPRYWYIQKAVEEEGKEKESYRLTSIGWLILTAYCLVTIALFIFLPEYLQEMQLSEWMILAGTYIYSGAVIGGAIYIMTQYSIQRAGNTTD